MSKINLVNSKHIQVPLWLMINILKSFSKMQQPTIKINQGTKFSSKYRRILYELEQYYGDEVLFGIYSSVDMVQSCASPRKSSFSRISKERCYRLSQEEKSIWDKLSETAKATILSDTKAPHKPSTHVKFHSATLVDIIKSSSHKFYFGDTPKGPFNNDLIGKYHRTNN